MAVAQIMQYQARKFTYDCASDKWDVLPVTLNINWHPFREGGMRVVHRAREIFDDGSEIDVVVKRVKPGSGLDPEINWHETVAQTVADSYAQDFNKACVKAGLRHNVAFAPVSVIKLPGVEEPLSMEPYLRGDYVKHNDNAGHQETSDEVAAAFSYFTYACSGGMLVICDIQGVGTFYTDPQIHTIDGKSFGGGNLGAKGIELFLKSHRHTLLCEQLGLPNPDAELSDEELARKYQEAEQEDAMRQMHMEQGGHPLLFQMPVTAPRPGGVVQQQYVTRLPARVAGRT